MAKGQLEIPPYRNLLGIFLNFFDFKLNCERATSGIAGNTDHIQIPPPPPPLPQSQFVRKAIAHDEEREGERESIVARGWIRESRLIS